ncbi:hypothetical protein ACWGID_32470 [Kribbella sp. NPDC054772]
MTDDLAARWANTVVPSWIYRWLMPAAWIGAIVVSIVSDTGGVLCSPDDPSICGPDPSFAIAMVACFGSLLLLWWQPAVAAALGVLFLLLELQYDDVAGARLAWTVYGALCVALLVAMVISRQGQRSLTEDLLRRPVTLPAAAPVRVSIRLLLAGALVLVGAAPRPSRSGPSTMRSCSAFSSPRWTTRRPTPGCTTPSTYSTRTTHRPR